MPVSSSSSSTTDVDKWLALSPSDATSSPGASARPPSSSSPALFAFSPGGTAYLATSHRDKFHATESTRTAEAASRASAGPFDSGTVKGKRPMVQLESDGARGFPSGSAHPLNEPTNAGKQVRLKKDGTRKRPAGLPPGSTTRKDGTPRQKPGPKPGAILRLDGQPRLKAGRKPDPSKRKRQPSISKAPTFRKDGQPRIKPGPPPGTLPWNYGLRGANSRKPPLRESSAGVPSGSATNVLQR